RFGHIGGLTVGVIFLAFVEYHMCVCCRNTFKLCRAPFGSVPNAYAQGSSGRLRFIGRLRIAERLFYHEYYLTVARRSFCTDRNAIYPDGILHPGYFKLLSADGGKFPAVGKIAEPDQSLDDMVLHIGFGFFLGS